MRPLFIGLAIMVLVVVLWHLSQGRSGGDGFDPLQPEARTASAMLNNALRQDSIF
jgi:hypothetical protein